MSVLSVTNTLVDGSTILASLFNTNYADIVSYVNNRNDGTNSWDALRVTTSSDIVAILDNSSGSSDILRCRDNGTVCLAVADGGATTITATGAATVPLTVTNGTSTGNILVVNDNAAAILTIADGGTLTYDGAAVFNEAGADVDFRIDGDTVTGLFLVDASADMVSIDSLHVGGTSDPGADNLIVDGTCAITGLTTTTGGVHVGGASDPGADNLLVDGTAEITGESTFTGMLKTVGGVHVGGTSDPGADNLIVDGTCAITGLTTTTGGVHVGGTSDPGADNLLVDGTGTFTGGITFGDGSATTPSITFASDPNTGLYSYSTDIIGFTAGGVLAAYLQSNSLVLPPTSGISAGYLLTTLTTGGGGVSPNSAGNQDAGNSTNYWGNVQTHDLTKSGGGTFGCFDDGVELQDGTIVSDTEALEQWTSHKTRKTRYGKPSLDYQKAPKDVIVYARDKSGKLFPRNENGEPVVDGIPRPDADGEAVFPTISIMIGAIKELTNRIKKLEIDNAHI